jgi:hypothetical protein
LIAEARALRGWFYFELAREFQYAYGKNPNAPGIPLYTNPASDTARGNPRGTLQQTFNQIEEDITYALQNIGTTQLLKDQVNNSVAWGMAARIYLEEGKWSNAQQAASQALLGHALDANGYASNYTDMTSPEVIWSFPQTTAEGSQSLYYGTPSSFFEKTGNGYDAFWISEEFVSHFSATDIRNSFYIYDPDPSQPDYLATNKFGTPDSSEVLLLNGYIAQQKKTDFSESLNMMRAGEMYLILAEARARLGEADADDTLFVLQSNRDPFAVQSNNTGQALLEEILLERRKELYGELGIDWLDAKRL